MCAHCHYSAPSRETRGGPKSDVDVLVDFDGDPTFDDYVGLTMFLEELLGRHVDVLTQDGIKPRARAAIEGDLVRVA